MSFGIARFVISKVSPDFNDCLRTDKTQVISLSSAQSQHARYAQELRGFGKIVQASGAPNCADAVFIEDTAVIIDHELALITCPGAPSRRPEAEATRAQLAEFMEIEVMEYPALLDGGDVLRVHDHIVVGLSGRTNLAGFGFLREIAEAKGIKVHALQVKASLHLKSAVTLASPDLLIYDPGAFGGTDFELHSMLGVEAVRAPEFLGANVLALPNRCVLVSAGAPRTQELLAGRELDVRPLEVQEFHKADGALTCMSLRIPPPGSWCT